MSFNWTEYFDVAQELYEQAKKSPVYQEAKVRIVISRAYYSAFGMARDHLRYKERISEFQQMNGERANIHEHVRKTFANSTDLKRAEIGANLDRLRKYRNIADYNLNDPMFNKPLVTAQATLRWAKDVLTALKNLH